MLVLNKKNKLYLKKSSDLSELFVQIFRALHFLLMYLLLKYLWLIYQLNNN